jgi:hypothetical protein
MKKVSDAIASTFYKIVIVSCDIPSLAFKTFKNSSPRRTYYTFTKSSGLLKKLENLQVNTAHGAIDRYIKLNESTTMLLQYDSSELDDYFEDSLNALMSHVTANDLKVVVFCKPRVARALSYCGKFIDANNSAEYSTNILGSLYSEFTANELQLINDSNIKHMLKSYYKTKDSKNFKEEFINEISINSGSNNLEYIKPNPHMYGLPKLSEWVLRRKPLIHGTHPVPIKGISLIGIPGVGKTKSAGLISHLLEIPAFKFNILSCMDRYVGQSESNVTDALDTIKSLGKCVILLDEVDKVFSRSDDNGASARVLSILLSFMDNNVDCFWVLTGNIISNIPPELLRKGRLNEYFYIGLPDRNGIHDYISYILNVYSNYGISYDEEYINHLTDFCVERKLLFNDIVSLMEDIYINFITGSNHELEVISSYYRYEEEFNKILEWSKEHAKPAV